jgi:hypothetical protein
MNQSQIDSLIATLISEDPSLQDHHAILQMIVPTLIKQRNSTTIDESFKKALKQKLDMQIAAQTRRTSPLGWQRGLGLATIGALVIVASGATGAALDRRFRPESVVSYVNITAPEIKTVQAKAFGTLEGVKEQSSLALSSSLTSATGSGVVTRGIPGTIEGDLTFAAPTQSYQAVVTQDIPLPPTTLDVYGYRAATPGAGILRGLVADSKIDGLETGYWSFIDKNGASISYDSQSGQLSISSYNPYSPVSPFEQKPENKASLSEGAMLQSAARYLADYGIVTTPFGAPKVIYTSFDQQSGTGRVVYPLVIDGKTVRNEYDGSPVGITIEFNAYYGPEPYSATVMSPRLVQSPYPVTQDVAKIKQYLELQVSMGMYAEPGVATKTLSFGAPVIGLVQTYYANLEATQNASAQPGPGRSYILPAYIFTANEDPANIVSVPLIDNVLTELIRNRSMAYPAIFSEASGAQPAN